MNPEKQQSQITPKEALEREKRGIVVETGVASSETVQDEKKADVEQGRKVEVSEVKRQADLKEVRRELGLDATLDRNPRINYIKVVIDDDYMRKNLTPAGGLRMQGGQANWDGEVDLMQYVIAENLSPEYRSIAAEKIEKQKAEEEKLYQHESHHIQNRENESTPHKAAKNLREFLTFRVLDEMSAFMAGELNNRDMTAENILQSLRIAEQRILDSYYGQTFSGEASWYMSQHGQEPEVLSRKIDQDRYHKIMRQYFKINGQNVLSILQKSNKMSEFTEITNRLVIKLNTLLDIEKNSSGIKSKN